MTVENGWSFIAVPSITIDPIRIKEVANNFKMSSFSWPLRRYSGRHCGRLFQGKVMKATKEFESKANLQIK